MATPIHKFKTHEGASFRIPDLVAPTIDGVQVDMTHADWGGWVFEVKDAQVNDQASAIITLLDVEDDSSGFTIASATSASMILLADDMPAIGGYHYNLGFTWQDLFRIVLHGQFVVEG